MYCKQCGHRAEGKADKCPKCGAKLSSAVDLSPASKPKLRWGVFILAAVVSVVVFVGFPRIFLRPEFEPIGPTNKLRFLRALDHSEYRRIGQSEFRLEGQSLVLISDLRWNTLPESKQQEIVRIIGRAWTAVGGENTRFRVEGEDGIVASYANGLVHLGPTDFQLDKN